MSSHWKTALFSALAFGLGFVVASAGRPASGDVEVGESAGLSWRLEDDIIHIRSHSPEQTFIAVASEAESERGEPTSWIVPLASDREWAFPRTGLERLTFAEVRSVVECRDRCLPCETGACTAPPPPTVVEGGKSSGYQGTVCDGQSCATASTVCQIVLRCG